MNFKHRGSFLSLKQKTRPRLSELSPRWAWIGRAIGHEAQTAHWLMPRSPGTQAVPFRDTGTRGKDIQLSPPYVHFA